MSGVWLPATRIAQRAYDKTMITLSERWTQVATTAEVVELLIEERAALELLQTAYWVDTQHINSRDRCRLITASDIARLIREDDLAVSR